MSTREAIIDKTKNAPESLMRETYDFILFLKRQRELEAGNAELGKLTTKPDFLARQRALFGERTLPGSETILDELRKDRF